MLRCYILDDEPLAVKGLELLIAAVPYLELAGASNEPFQALEEIPRINPDICTPRFEEGRYVEIS